MLLWNWDVLRSAANDPEPWRQDLAATDSLEIMLRMEKRTRGQITTSLTSLWTTTTLAGHNARATKIMKVWHGGARGKHYRINLRNRSFARRGVIGPNINDPMPKHATAQTISKSLRIKVAVDILKSSNIFLPYLLSYIAHYLQWWKQPAPFAKLDVSTICASCLRPLKPRLILRLLLSFTTLNLRWFFGVI